MWPITPLEINDTIQYSQIMIKLKKPPNSVNHFYILHYHKKSYPRISFRVKTTDIDNQYDLYSITCEDWSFMLEGVGLSVSYAPVSGIRYVHIIIAITSAEDLIFFVLEISNNFQNNILPNPKERVYFSLPHLYLGLFKIKWQKIHYHQEIKNNLAINP